jgi:hypothetical protein
VEYAPGIPLRLAWLKSRAGNRSTGLLAPVISAAALTTVLGLLGLVTANVPYGRPIGTPGATVTVPVAAAEGIADGSPTALAQTAPGVQPGSGLATLGSAPASGGTSPGSALFIAAVRNRVIRRYLAGAADRGEFPRSWHVRKLCLTQHLA